MADIDDKRKKAQDLRPMSATPTQSDVDPIFFSEMSSPPALVIPPVPAAHSQSRTWKSGDTKEKEEFARLRTLLHHLVPESPFVPPSHAAWVEHRAYMNAMEVENMKRNIDIKKAKTTAAAKTAVKPVLDGKFFVDNRSAVLSLNTIWAPWSTPTDKHPEAVWPDRTELQYEGDDRAKSAVGRFLPLPRRPGNETVNWKAREQLQAHRPLDHVGMFKEDGTPDFGMRQGGDELHPASDSASLAETLLGEALMAELE